LSKSNKSLWS